MVSFTGHPNDAVLERPRKATQEPEVDPDVAHVTLEDVTLALSHRIGLPPEDMEREATFVMDIFGFEDRVIDNVLEREDRQLFYVLEEEGMVSTDREENALHDGREWRTHYWSLRKDVVKRYTAEQREGVRARRVSTEADVYREIPQDAWASRRF